MNITFEMILELACTVAILSYLYRETPLYRLGENIFIGVNIGNTLVITLDAIRATAVAPLLKGDFTWMVPLILGACMFTFFSKRIFYLYRIPMALIIGTGVGIGIYGTVHGLLLQQTIANLTLLSPGQDLLTMLNGLIIGLGSMSVFYYFVFTFFLKRRGIAAVPSTAARYVLMITFGAYFANTVMGRTAYLTGRLEFFWLTDVKYLIPFVLLLFAGFIVYDEYKRKHLEGAFGAIQQSK